MQVRHLVPTVVLVAIVWHSGKSLKARVAGVVGAKDKVLVTQRLGTIGDALLLELTSGSEAPATQEEFYDFCRRRVRTKGGGARDSQYRDAWGTPLLYVFDGQRITLTSAGMDRSFGTADDVRRTFDANEY